MGGRNRIWSCVGAGLGVGDSREKSQGSGKGTRRGPHFKFPIPFNPAARTDSEFMDPHTMGNWAPPWDCKTERLGNYQRG